MASMPVLLTRARGEGPPSARGDQPRLHNSIEKSELAVLCKINDNASITHPFPSHPVHLHLPQSRFRSCATPGRVKRCGTSPWSRGINYRGQQSRPRPTRLRHMGPGNETGCRWARLPQLPGIKCHNAESTEVHQRHSVMLGPGAPLARIASAPCASLQCSRMQRRRNAANSMIYTESPAAVASPSATARGPKRHAMEAVCISVSFSAASNANCLLDKQSISRWRRDHKGAQLVTTSPLEGPKQGGIASLEHRRG